MKTLGIIFILEAMAVSFLMVGTHPVVAAEYQMIVYLMILSSGAINSLNAFYLARRKMFTTAEQIADWIAPD